MKEFYCPFLMIMGNLGMAAFCKKEQCAWWVNDKKECAIHAFWEIREKLDCIIEMGEKIFYSENSKFYCKK